MSVADDLVLERMGPAEAAVGMISLPLPRDLAGKVTLAHQPTALVPVGWWQRHQVPRRVIAYVLAEHGVPATLRLHETPPVAPGTTGPAPWTVATRITHEQLEFVAHRFDRISDLRGVPAADCTTVEGELVLTWGGQTVTLQFGATSRHDAGAYHWQNVQLDRLWRNDVAEGIRVGGVLYNGDTYLWADVYVVLFANGVADLTAHFVNTKLHITGYDFRGLPFVRFGGSAVTPAAATLPRDGHRFQLGALQLNLGDSAELCSEKLPGRLEPDGASVRWWPVARVRHPQLPNAPENEWQIGMARTFRCQFSLGSAPPVIARYRAPAWWYALAGEPWAGGWLPVRGRLDRVGELASDHLRGWMKRGCFEAGSADFGNDGDAGVGIMQNYYHTGRPEVFADALLYCHFWADLMVDHTDFSVHQWVGGWPWKTCAYSKFRDVLYAWLETGDPWLLDTVENAAEAYWAWFRSNWPRATIGRDAFEIGAWALLWRFLASERARERCAEFARMVRTVLHTRGEIGGQIGAGPHPGYISSLYMTGVAMVSLAEIGEAQAEMAQGEVVPDVPDLLHRLDQRYRRLDVEQFPSNYGERPCWHAGRQAVWGSLACRAYPVLARLQGATDEAVATVLTRLADQVPLTADEWGAGGRIGTNLIHPLCHDALVLGAQWTADGLRLMPLDSPTVWPRRQVVETPRGPVEVRAELTAAGIQLRFTADLEFAVSVVWRGWTGAATSRGSLLLPNTAPDPQPDLTPYVAKGFGGNFDEGLATVPVKGVDRTQAQSIVRVCGATEYYLYEGAFSPRRIRYQPGARPELERMVQPFTGSPRARALAAMAWVCRNVVHPHLTGPLPGDRALTEEQLIASGRGWCNEQSRVFVALCEVMEIPARMCFLFHVHGRSGHVTAEAFVDGRWAFFDVTFNLAVPLPSGLLAEGRELSGEYRALAHAAYRPCLTEHYRHIHPFVEANPGWNQHERPTVERGGDLLGTLGLTNYLVDGVGRAD